MESFADYICEKEELLGSNLICLGDYNIPHYHPPGIEPAPNINIDTSPDPEVFDIDIQTKTPIPQHPLFLMIKMLKITSALSLKLEVLSYIYIESSTSMI
ncbi:hypothetical protein M8J77_004513 [Diaphorina citri]|nr:hypothetical protein M8J77_004513 [Diaphorina citri]